jgi:hypothetical protein
MTSLPSRPAPSSGSNAFSKRISPHVAIIIVNYKGREDTLECLASLAGLTYPNYSVVLVDQASGDGTADAVRASFPSVAVIENPVNDGFAGGNNLGIRRALDAGADYVFLLNNDTTVAPDLLDRLVKAAEANPEIGIAGALMLYHSEPGIVWSSGGRMGARGESLMLDQGRPAAEVATSGGGQLIESDFVVGCGLMAKRTVLERVGLMDERYFLYYEESDLCARAWAAGWRVVTVPDAWLWHKVSRSTGTDSELTLYYMRRNALLYLERNARRPMAARLASTVDSVYLAAVWAIRGERRRARVLLRAVGDYWRGRLGKSDFPFRPARAT